MSVLTSARSGADTRCIRSPVYRRRASHAFRGSTPAFENVRIILGEEGLWQESIDFGNIPDAWIQYGGGEAFIEIDLGTEHVPVLKKKFDTYIAFKESGRYERLFPGCTFKVLVFTTTEERIEALEQVTNTDDIWFCTLDEFVREKLTHEHWFALLGFYALSVTPKKEM